METKKSGKGYYGVGILNPRKVGNIGSLFRSAFCFGADFIYTIGSKYKRDAGDTPNSVKNIPYFHFSTIEDFLKGKPEDSIIVCVENSEKAIPIKKFSHPARACYLLGSEVSGIPAELTGRFPTVIIPTSQCLNVSVAGSIVLYDRINKKG